MKSITSFVWSFQGWLVSASNRQYLGFLIRIERFDQGRATGPLQDGDDSTGFDGGGRIACAAAAAAATAAATAARSAPRLRIFGLSRWRRNGRYRRRHLDFDAVLIVRRPLYATQRRKRRVQST